MSKWRALVLAVALAACGQTGEKGATAPAQSETPDPLSLSIEVGRYSVMLSQIHSLSEERTGAVAGEVTEPQDLARRLRETVWEYNLERSSLCGRGLFTDVACGPAYQPVWIGETADSAPTLAELQTRANAVGEEVMRFWNTVCEDARTRETDEQAKMYVCAIE